MTGSSRSTGLVKQVVADEGLHLGIEQVVAADQPQVLQELPREERDDRAVVGRPGAVELDGVIDLVVQHGLEDDLARLLRREGLERAAWGCRSVGFEFVEVLELAVEAAGQSAAARCRVRRCPCRRSRLSTSTTKRVLAAPPTGAAHRHAVEGRRLRSGSTRRTP